MTAVELTGAGLATADVVAVARHDAAVRLGAHACERMAAGAEAVRRAVAATLAPGALWRFAECLHRGAKTTVLLHERT